MYIVHSHFHRVRVAQIPVYFCRLTTVSGSTPTGYLLIIFQTYVYIYTCIHMDICMYVYLYIFSSGQVGHDRHDCFIGHFVSISRQDEYS